MSIHPNSSQTKQRTYCQTKELTCPYVRIRLKTLGFQKRFNSVQIQTKTRNLQYAVSVKLIGHFTFKFQQVFKANIFFNTHRALTSDILITAIPTSVLSFSAPENTRPGFDIGLYVESVPITIIYMLV